MGHIFYASIESFIDHLLWALSENRYCHDSVSKRHLILMTNLLILYPSLCGICQNRILSTIPLRELHRSHDCEPTGNPSCCTCTHGCPLKRNLALLFYDRLSQHPRMPKISAFEYISEPDWVFDEDFDCLCKR